MGYKKPRALWVQVVLFLFLSLFLSTVPGLLGLLVGRPGLGSALFASWYGLGPPIFLFLLAWWLYRGELNWLRFLGRLWLGTGTWFLVQVVLTSVSGNLVTMLLSLPAVLAGNQGFALAAGIFVLGGAGLFAVGTYGSRAPTVSAARPAPALVGRLLALALALVVIGLPVFVYFVAVPGGVTTGENLPAPPPTEEEIFGYIRDIYNFGSRRPGSPEAAATAEYIVARLEEFGFEEIHVETTTFDYWKPLQWNLTVDMGSGPTSLESFYVPYSGPTSAAGVSAPVVYVGNGEPAEWRGQDLKGKIVLVDLPVMNVSWDQLEIFSFMAYDPTGNTAGWTRPYPIGWMLHFWEIYPALEEAGVAGIIGILNDYPEMSDLSYYAPYDGILREVPSLYIREDDGQLLKEALSDGAEVEARIVLEAEVTLEGGQAPLIYAVLPGRSSSTFIIHSHYDSPWPSAVEDSSGTGMVLALARYYSEVPPAERQRTLVFLFTGSHMVGSPTNDDFLKRHQDDILGNTLFDIAIEHIADDYPFNDHQPSARGTFVTENPVVITLFARSLVQTGLRRTLIFPTETPLGVPTDAGHFEEAGIPIVSLISGPVYLFDKADTLDRIVKEDLEPLAAMYIDFIARMNRLPDAFFKFKVNGLSLGLLLILFSPLALASFVYGYRSRQRADTKANSMRTP